MVSSLECEKAILGNDLTLFKRKSMAMLMMKLKNPSIA